MTLSMADISDPLKTEEDVEEILRIAVRNTGVDGGSLRQRLASTASELGISEEALELAEQTWRARRASELSAYEEQKLLREYRRIRWGDFVQHLGIYFAINAFLYWIDYQDGKLTWFVWPLMSWGIAVFIHAVSMFFHGAQEEREYQRWKKRRIKNGL